MALSLNPAGLVDVSRQFQAGVGMFRPYRDYTATGTQLVAPGHQESDMTFFLMPNMAYSRPIDADSCVGLGALRQWRHEHDLAQCSQHQPGLRHVRQQAGRLLRRRRRRRPDAGFPVVRIRQAHGRGLGRHRADHRPATFQGDRPVGLWQLLAGSRQSHRPRLRLFVWRRLAGRRRMDRRAQCAARIIRADADVDDELRQVSGPVRRKRRLRHSGQRHRRRGVGRHP